MKIISTSQVAKRLGIHVDTLANYIAVGKLPAPMILQLGRRTVHAWTEAEIERARQLLPKIANGRKTRYQKKQSAVGARPTVKGKAKKQKTKKKSRP